MKRRKVLVLHTDVAPDAPPDELDTLDQVEAIGAALAGRGHTIVCARFPPQESALEALVLRHAPDVIFNLVEAIDGSGARAVEVPGQLERLGIPYTGATRRALVDAGDKPSAKRRLREAGLPTPDWSEPPDWEGIKQAPMIVKSALEDCSLGLDDGAIVLGADAVRKRAALSTSIHGGRWFAETYVEGREFNVAVLEKSGGPHVLPLAEMTFQEWQKGRPRIVGYSAKWDDDSFESTRTVRAFGVDEVEPQLAEALRDLAERAWRLFEMRGYVRVDFRVGQDGAPTILELNPNPCLAPDAGFAAAAERVGLSYADLMEHILSAALA